MALRPSLAWNVPSPRLFWLVLVALVLGLILFLQRGPGKTSVGHVVPVSGEVTVGNEPLEEGTITFIPDSAKGNTSRYCPSGKVEKGVYELFTEGENGAPPGWYKVIVSSFTLDLNRPAPALFDRRFGNPDRTPLSIEVVDSLGEKSYDFRLPAPN